MIGKIHLQQCNNSLARLLIVGLLLVGMSGGMVGCNLLNAIPDKPDTPDVKPDPGPTPQPLPDPFPKPDPLPEPKPPEPLTYVEADYWNALADLVEAGRISNTEQIVMVVESQKALKNIKDDTRVKEYQAKRSEVTDANRNFIANKLRGN